MIMVVGKVMALRVQRIVFFGGCLASRTAMATYVKMCGSTDQLRTVRCGADAPLAPYYWVIGQLGSVPYYLWQGPTFQW